MTVKQNLTNEMGSSSVRTVITILVKTREPSTKYGNTTDVNNQNTAEQQRILLISQSLP